ncbi:hypothetical protein DAEQUDRAFT_648899, partial [Daedalea quercina L-15889]
YDGKGDPQKFNHFVWQMKEYLQGYSVKKTMYASTISNFLVEKVEQFFTNVVEAKRPETWALDKFFMELSNYCFDVNFRLQQQTKLNEIEQGNHSMRDYVHEFKELVQMVGLLSKQEKVSKLWLGFIPTIQGDLWLRGLSPLTSSWHKVIRAAELIEIA